MFKAQIINTGVTLAGLAVGVLGGSLVTIALGIAAAFFIHAAVSAYYLIKVGFGKPMNIFKEFLPELICGMVACVLCLAISHVLPFGSIGNLAVKAVVIAVVIGFGYQITGQLQHLKAIVKK